MEFTQSGAEDFFIKVTELIEAKLVNELFGVSELARDMGMSRSNLHRRIKSITGLTASQFIRKIRLKKAMELLKESSFTVAEVAFKVGFRSATYFSKCFHNHYGYSPGKVKWDSPHEANPENIEPDQSEEDIRNSLNNFPVQLTSFIGREKEIIIIAGLITEHRIVSLVGFGGCGKTRLACEVVAHLVQHYNDGIWFVDMVPIETEDLVVKQIMTSLSIPEKPGQDWMETLIDKIRDKKLMILLDNCEHLLSACAEITGELVQSVPGLQVVTTSREALNIKGENVWRISPLTLIDPETINDVSHARNSEAVCLFSDRAILNHPGFELARENAREVATICKLVDGIPLAIELVANRARHMDAEMMLDRLAEKFSEIHSNDPRTSMRQRSLQATIEWSYNLLSNEEKALFRRLSVFTGGFELMAVEEICSDDSLAKESILELLSHLIDCSMIYTK